MVTTFSRARKQRIDALVNADDEGSSLLKDAWSRLAVPRCSGSAR